MLTEGHPCFCRWRAIRSSVAQVVRKLAGSPSLLTCARAGHGFLTSHQSLSSARLCLLMLCPQLLALLPHTHLEVPTSWSPCFSHQSNAENKQCPAPAYCLVRDMLRSTELFEVVEGWPESRSHPFLLPYSAVLTMWPGEWREGSSWPLSLTQAPEPQGEPDAILIPYRSGAKLGAKNQSRSSVNLGSHLGPRRGKNP